VDADELYEQTGVDLRPGSGRVEEGVIKLLQGHPKVDRDCASRTEAPPVGHVMISSVIRS
jgi:hypothetical protein